MASGGRFEMKNGKRVPIAGTENHPDGNRARDKDGTPLGTDGKPPAKAEKAKAGSDVTAKN